MTYKNHKIQFKIMKYILTWFFLLASSLLFAQTFRKYFSITPSAYRKGKI